jgi:uncharacterized protein
MTNGPTELERNKALVAEFLRVFSRGDVPGVLAGMHQQGSWWVSGRIDGISGTYSREQLGKLLESVRPVYKEGALRVIPSSMVAEGNRVAVEAESFAELRNGRVYNCQYHFLFEIESGKVTTVKEYVDTKHLFDTFVAG